jgi:hypothetical protein
MYEKLRETINGLAKRANMKEEDLQKLYARFEHEEKGYGCPDDELEEVVLEDMEGFLRKKFLVAGSQVPVTGAVFSRSNAMDQAKKLHEAAEKYIEAEGEEAAIEAGYAKKDDKGNLIHIYPSDQFNDRYNRTGKTIPEHDWQADGTGVINYQQKEGEDDVRFAELRFKGNAATEPIQLFKELSMKAFVVDKKNENKYRFTISQVPELASDDKYIDFKEALPYIKKAYPGRILSFSEVEEFYDEAESTFNLWCLVQGKIDEIGATQKGGTIVTVHDVDMDVNDGDSERIIFAKESDLDLTVGARGYFFVNPTRDSEGRMSYFGLGYWVPNYKRVDRERISGEETPDAEKGWGV